MEGCEGVRKGVSGLEGVWLVLEGCDGARDDVEVCGIVRKGLKSYDDVMYNADGGGCGDMCFCREGCG